MLAIIVIAAIFLCVMWLFLIPMEEYGRKIFIPIFTIITIVVLIGLIWFSTTASGRRAIKTTQSNLVNGIPRTVEVYSVDGTLLKKYEGKFDIQYDDNQILFDDENGKRHIIFYPTGTVIVDEN